MTLDEAISYAKDKALEMCTKRETQIDGKKYLQLAKWLSELKIYREKSNNIKPEFKDLI